MTNRSARTALTAALVATAAVAATTAPAPAAPRPHSTTTARATTPTGSIVFIRASNVWLTRPDGSGMRQVTTDGTATSPYEHPTMSTAGVIAVMKGSQIIRMEQGGAVLNRMTPQDLFVADYGTIHITPIMEPEISPDGTKIAYSQLRLEHYGGGDYNYNKSESVTAVTDATRFTQPTKVQLGYQPGWVGNNRFTLDRDGDVHLADLGQDATAWFRSDDIFDTHDPLDPFIALNEPEVSPDGTRVLVGVQDTGFAMKSTTSDPTVGAPGKPTAAPQCFMYADVPGVFAENATFGPDSDSAVYTEAGKLSVIRNLAACNATTTIDVLTTDASEPDWSPADLAPPGTPGTPGNGGGGGGGGGAVTHAFKLTEAPAVTGKPRVGRKLRAGHGSWAPAPTTYVVTWLRNGKAVHTGSTYKVTKADRGKRIQVRVTVRRAGYDARTATSAAVKVKKA